jgi:perosamine synthetase
MSANPIYFNRPCLAEQDIVAVVKTLQSNYFAEGAVSNFVEEKISEFLGGGFSRSTSSGTAALYLILKALNLSPEARVAVPTYACTALLDAIRLANLAPVVVDIESDSPNIKWSEVPFAPSICPDAVICIHSFGIPSYIPPQPRNFFIIEDCCHSVGGFRGQVPLGSESDAAAFSFYATKILAAGSGGLVFSKSQKLIDTIDAFLEPVWQKSNEQHFNMRSDDINAALIVSQMERLDKMRARRQYIYDRYEQSSIRGGYEILFARSGMNIMPYRFVILAKGQSDRNRIVQNFSAKAIQTSNLIEGHELLHRKLGLGDKMFPNAELLSQRTIALPLHLNLMDDEIDYICETLEEGVGKL